MDTRFCNLLSKNFSKPDILCAYNSKAGVYNNNSYECDTFVKNQKRSFILIVIFSMLKQYCSLSLIGIIILNSFTLFAQSYTIQRGHLNDDLYIYCRKNLTSKTIYQLYRTTEYGKTIKVQYTIPYPSPDNDLNLKNLVADITPGMLFCTSINNADTAIYQSTDYGKTWQHLSTFFYSQNPPITLLGGSVAGEIILTERPSNQSYGIGSTTDFFATHTINALYSSYFSKPEIGINSGEIYGINNAYSSNRDFILHTVDFGMTIDTIPIDSNIVYNPNGNLAQKVCHGTLPGELYLVTLEAEQTGFPHVYKIYHSSDYGASYTFQSTAKFDESSSNTDFTGGREDCSFYIANWTYDQVEQLQILQIYYSNDCGLTFSLFEHVLDENVNTPESASSNLSYISVSPNPAVSQATIHYQVRKSGNVKLNISSIDGKVITNLLDENQPAGLYDLKLDCSNFKPGVYFVQLIQENGYSSGCKLIICK